MNKYEILIILIILITLSSCTNVRTQKDQELELKTLLLSTNDLPLNYKVSSIGPGIDPDRSKDSIGIGIYSDVFPDSLGISQNVNRFQRISSAKYDFSNYLDYFASGYIPQAWSYKSEIADETVFACFHASNIAFPRCE
jgi:hypothetical protein